MDSSQETANRANIKTARLTVWILALTALLAVVGILTLLLLIYPPTSQAPPANQGGAFMVSTLVIVLSSSLVLAAISLFIAAFRLLKLKRLKANLKTANAAFADMEERVEKLGKELTSSRRDAENERKRANYEESQRDQFIRLEAEARRELADLAWLRQLAEEQGKNISEHVLITAVKPGSLILSKGRYPLCVTVAFRIKNESVFDITIHPKAITGRFSFNGQFLEEAAGQLLDEDRTAIEDLKPNKAEILVLKQPLLKSEAEFISGLQGDDKVRFWLGNLSIPISVTAAAPIQVQPQDLRINSKVEYVYLGEFGALTLDERAMTPQELIQKLDALPLTEKMKVYREALKSYVESIVRLHEAEQDRDPESST